METVDEGIARLFEHGASPTGYRDEIGYSGSTRLTAPLLGAFHDGVHHNLDAYAACLASSLPTNFSRDGSRVRATESRHAGRAARCSCRHSPHSSPPVGSLLRDQYSRRG
jgi:hypothetical protein